jgi:hypothetical protein
VVSLSAAAAGTSYGDLEDPRVVRTRRGDCSLFRLRGARAGVYPRWMYSALAPFEERTHTRYAWCMVAEAVALQSSPCWLTPSHSTKSCGRSVHAARRRRPPSRTVHCHERGVCRAHVAAEMDVALCAPSTTTARRAGNGQCETRPLLVGCLAEDARCSPHAPTTNASTATLTDAPLRILLALAAGCGTVGGGTARCSLGRPGFGECLAGVLEGGEHDADAVGANDAIPKGYRHQEPDG